MSVEVWICAYFDALLPGVKSRDATDCPNADLVSHRHLPFGAILERCGWYTVAVLREADDER